MTTTWPRAPGSPAASPPPPGGWQELAPLTGEAYEAWVAGRDPDTGAPRGRLRTDDRAVRFVEVVVNGPKSWSLAAALHPDDRRRLRRGAGPRRRPDHRLARRARHHPGRPARRAGAGAGRGAGGGDGAALHLPRRRSAPASAPADQRPGVRRREMARAAHRRRPRLPRRDQRDRARRGRLRPAVPRRAGRPRLHPGRDWRNTGARRVRRPVQRAGGADRAQSGPLRTRMDGRAPRRTPGAGAAAGVGRPGVGRGPPGQGHPAARARTSPRGGGPSWPPSATATPTRPVDLAPTPVGALDRDARRRAGC